ncbi:hypothetical protein [Soonwooa sp.]|uniref:hypothetical protein n=1 Tax=Soonwooa sp. TaxID=1938592 RepID=UPI0028ADF4E9|nr:hypothetical protein [Soonwooa sp.]
MDGNFVKFVYRIDNQVLYAKIEDIINLEYENKKWLWDIPKENIIKTYKKVGIRFEEFEDIALENL